LLELKGIVMVYLCQDYARESRAALPQPIRL
jgi:hypothetical protein